MSIKSKGRALGRKIRRVTGLKLPIAMRIGALIVRGRDYDAMQKFPEAFRYRTMCQCCGPEPFLIGPKGSVAGYGITTEIEKEYRRMQEKAK